MKPQKFPITEDQIDTLVAAFYARIRVHPELGPVFLRAIGTSDAAWRAHEARIASFWRNAVGMDRSFSGNPMRKHMENREIVPELFPAWLALFRQTAEEILPREAALGIAALADRIGKGLSFGLVQFRQPEGAPPRFTAVSTGPLPEVSVRRSVR